MSGTRSAHPSDIKTCQFCGSAIRPGKSQRRNRFCSRRCSGLSRFPDALTRIRQSVIIDENGCWLWKRFLRDGYGRIKVNGKECNASRVSYELHYGPIPFGMLLRHKCRVRACCNPKHMAIVDTSEQVECSPKRFAFVNRHRTHCIHGHEFTEQNTYRTKRGGRDCRKCRVIFNRKYLAKKKAFKTTAT
jgi:hypothetical protein